MTFSETQLEKNIKNEPDQLSLIIKNEQLKENHLSENIELSLKSEELNKNL